MTRFQQAKTKAAPHFVVGQAGGGAAREAEAPAWHDSGRNGESVGIEHVARTPGELGPDDAGLALTEEQLAASAVLVSWLLGHLGLELDAVVPHCSNPRAAIATAGWMSPRAAFGPGRDTDR